MYLTDETGPGPKSLKIGSW